MAAPAETRTPNLHRAKQNCSSKSADLPQSVLYTRGLSLLRWANSLFTLSALLRLCQFLIREVPHRANQHGMNESEMEMKFHNRTLAILLSTLVSFAVASIVSAQNTTNENVCGGKTFPCSLHQTNAELTIIPIPTPIPNVGNLVGAGRVGSPELMATQSFAAPISTRIRRTLDTTRTR